MESNHVLLVTAIVAIVAVVGITQFVAAANLRSALHIPADASSNCIRGLERAAAANNCQQEDFEVAGYAFYLKESGDIKGARDYCQNAPTKGCKGLCTAALDCLETLG